MKQLLFFLFLFVYGGSQAQQNGNFCQLLYNAFNSADEGFPFMRSGTSPDIKESVNQTMGKFLQQISDGCFSQQLKWSDLILPGENSSSNLVSYFYPKTISIPENTEEAKIDMLLSETTYIKVFFEAPWIGSGFYLNYSINGIKYN
jgi:hypothetical protein